MKHRLFLSTLLLCLISCKKFVDVQVPQDRLLAERVFTEDAKALSALAGLYGNMINGSPSFANSLTTLYGGYSGGELERFNPPFADEEIMNSAIQPANSAVLSLWRSAYQVIYHANSIAEGALQSTSLSPAVQQHLLGESRLVRALCYFYLVNFFGDVPLVTTTDYRVTASLPRAPRAAVYQQLTADLKQAVELLPAAYPGGERNRPNKWAATALLARVYLYTGNWTEAEDAATKVISSGLYTPLPQAGAVFLKNSREAIWQLSPTSGLLKETNLLRPTGSGPQVYLSAETMNAFSPGDERRAKWIDSTVHQGKTYYLPGKYRNTLATPTEYYMILRLSEQYLLRAEARAMQNKPGVEDDLNAVRQRAGIPPLSVLSSQADQLSAIEKERERELFAEWGHRWFDLKRWNKASAVLSPLRPDFQSTDTLYPVPFDELLNNPFLTQNKGY